MINFQKINYVCLTDSGLKHKENQDSFMIDKIYENNVNFYKSGSLYKLFGAKELLVASIFDGVGGALKGEVASFMCAKTIKQIISSHSDLIKNGFNEKFIEQVVLDLNNNVKIKQKDLNVDNMMTTFVGTILSKNEILFLNIGDSKSYIYKNETLEQISHDDTYKNKLLSEGNLSIEEIESMDTSHIITNCLGIKNFDVKTTHYKIQKKEKCLILLMSDGVSDLISKNELQLLIMKNKNINDLAYCIRNMVIERGAHDNYTLILMEVK